MTMKRSNATTRVIDIAPVVAGGQRTFPVWVNISALPITWQGMMQRVDEVRRVEAIRERMKRIFAHPYLGHKMREIISRRYHARMRGDEMKQNQKGEQSCR